jgi:hypothetical protein
VQVGSAKWPTQQGLATEEIMKTRRLLTAFSLCVAMALTTTPVQAGWSDPVDQGPGSLTADSLTQAVVLGLELSQVIL